MNISNTTLALLLVASLVLSIGGTFLSVSRFNNIAARGLQGPITGRIGSDTGNVTFTINTTASLQFVNKTINFGSGSVNISGSYANCSLDSMGLIESGNCVGWNNVTEPLLLMNDGNKDLSVTVISSYNATALIGGSLGGGPLFQWNITNNESGACTFDPSFTAYAGLFTAVNITSQNLCSNLSWLDNQDSMKFHVFINIPSDSLTGQRNATFTATGTQL